MLLSEGSSLSSRQAITALGCAGYRVELCDPDPFCIGRISRFVRHFYKCPAMGVDPTGYFNFVMKLMRTGKYEVLLPTHEQAYLFSRVRDRILQYAGLALPDFETFEQVQSKVKFFKLLSHNALHHQLE